MSYQILGMNKSIYKSTKYILNENGKILFNENNVSVSVECDRFLYKIIIYNKILNIYYSLNLSEYEVSAHKRHVGKSADFDVCYISDPYLIEFTHYTTNSLFFNKNIDLVEYYDNFTICIDNKNILEYSEGFDDLYPDGYIYIDESIYIDKKDLNLIGKIIIKELIQKVFHPKRLLKICHEFKIELINLVKIY